MKVFIDYEVLHTCQFPVECVSCAETETDCGAPAMYRVYWTLEDGIEDGEMLVCQEHFDFIMECEKQPEKG